MVVHPGPAQPGGDRLLIATFLFCVLVLHRMGAATADLAPQVSLTVAVLLTVVTVLHIVDHLARGLQVGEVVRHIAQEGQQVLAATLHATRTERPAHHASRTTRLLPTRPCSP